MLNSSYSASLATSQPTATKINGIEIGFFLGIVREKRALLSLFQSGVKIHMMDAIKYQLKLCIFTKNTDI
jgi:hypothetical protein